MSRRVRVLLVALLSLGGCLQPKARLQSPEEDRDREPEVKNVGELTGVANADGVPLSGVGLLVGLDGTGGGTPPPSGFRTLLEDQLRKRGVENVKEVLSDQTSRTDGSSLPMIIGGLNRRMRGWSGYFAGGNGNLYTRLDQWLRMRLRSLLRKRERRKGRGRGTDHQRYPNVYFAELGLISLNALTRAKRANPA